jgi:hypothetical protein
MAKEADVTEEQQPVGLVLGSEATTTQEFRVGLHAEE